jgi:hypothetical protein
MIDPLRQLKSALISSEPPPDAKTFALSGQPNLVYSVGRFLASWAQAGSFGPDQAVLLRQALRWSPSSSLLVGIKPPDDPDFLRCLDNAEISWSPMGQLRVKPFVPLWLNESPACDAPPKNELLMKAFPPKRTWSPWAIANGARWRRRRQLGSRFKPRRDRHG